MVTIGTVRDGVLSRSGIMALLLSACSTPFATGDAAAPEAMAGNADTGETGDTGVPDSETAADSDTGDTADSADSGETGDTAETGGEDTATPLPCAAYGMPAEIAHVDDADLGEISGIAVSRRHPDLLWVHEDHAGDAAVYALDQNGATVATVWLDGATNNDWEDIAVGRCGADTCVYVGEIGNNDFTRTDFGVYRFREPDLDPTVLGQELHLTPDWLPFDYPDTDYNAEALAVTADGLPVVLTKDYDTHTSWVFVYPEVVPNVDEPLVALGSVSTATDDATSGAAATAADLWPGDSRLLLRTYGHVWEFDLSGGLAAIATAPMSDAGGAVETHGEAVAYDAFRRGFWQVPEGINPAISFTGCAEE